jgi:hypothetical protein
MIRETAPGITEAKDNVCMYSCEHTHLHLREMKRRVKNTRR